MGLMKLCCYFLVSLVSTLYLYMLTNSTIIAIKYDYSKKFQLNIQLKEFENNYIINQVSEV